MGDFVEHYFAKQGWHNHVMGPQKLRYIHPWGQTYKGRNDMGAHILGAFQPRGLSNKGRNIQEFPVRDSPVRDAITLHQFLFYTSLLYTSSVKWLVILRLLHIHFILVSCAVSTQTSRI
jgi:hypothetical protein